MPAEIHVVMDEQSLLGEGEVPAWLSGFGPVPAKAVRRFVVDSPAGVFLRRLFTRPEDGLLVGMDSQRRDFTRLLRRMVLLRDGVCRSPWCDAPIRHVDHAVRAADGGDTSWSNASGLCAACNFAKESAGWTHEATPAGLKVITPTGHNYAVPTPPLLPRLSTSLSGDPEGPAPGSPAQPDPPMPQPDPPGVLHHRPSELPEGRDCSCAPGADTSGASKSAEECGMPAEAIVIDDEFGGVDEWGIPWRHVPSRGHEYESAARAFRMLGDFGPMRRWLRRPEAARLEAMSAAPALPDPLALGRRSSQLDLHLAAVLSAWRAENPEHRSQGHTVETVLQ